MTLLEQEVNNEAELQFKLELEDAAYENRYTYRSHHMKEASKWLSQYEMYSKLALDPERNTKIVEAMIDLLNEPDYKQRMTLYEWIIKELRNGGVIA